MEVVKKLLLLDKLCNGYPKGNCRPHAGCQEMISFTIMLLDYVISAGPGFRLCLV